MAGQLGYTETEWKEIFRVSAWLKRHAQAATEEEATLKSIGIVMGGSYDPSAYPDEPAPASLPTPKAARTPQVKLKERSEANLAQLLDEIRGLELEIASRRAVLARFNRTQRPPEACMRIKRVEGVVGGSPAVAATWL